MANLGSPWLRTWAKTLQPYVNASYGLIRSHEAFFQRSGSLGKNRKRFPMLWQVIPHTGVCPNQWLASRFLFEYRHFCFWVWRRVWKIHLEHTLPLYCHCVEDVTHPKSILLFIMFLYQPDIPEINQLYAACFFNGLTLDIAHGSFPSHSKMPGPSRKARRLAWQYSRGEPWLHSEQISLVETMVHYQVSMCIALTFPIAWQASDTLKMDSVLWLCDCSRFFPIEEFNAWFHINVQLCSEAHIWVKGLVIHHPTLTGILHWNHQLCHCRLHGCEGC